ncbi:MAG: hypothetical protein U1F35_15980 [Steroidobacteraceae bacterium]
MRMSRTGHPRQQRTQAGRQRTDLVEVRRPRLDRYARFGVQSRINAWRIVVLLRTAPHDAQAVETFIRQWLIDNKRIDAPIYLMGESYGGYRICVMSPRVADLNIAGVIMISPALDLTDGRDAGYSMPSSTASRPTLAVAAWHHGRVAARLGSTAEQVFDAAAQFAQTQLLVALERGTQLATPERDRIASLDAFVGLPPESIARANLKIDPQVFTDLDSGPDGGAAGYEGDGAGRTRMP